MAALTEQFYHHLVDTALFHLEKYEGGEEVISDYAYDQLVINIRSIEARNPAWLRPDSPTQIISVSKSLIADKKQPHAVRMGSQSNITTPNDLLKFCSSTRYTLYCVEPKYDGLSLALHYAYGRLCRAPLRGNGLAGNDVFDNASEVKGVPGSLPLADALTVFHGEVVISIENFNRVNNILAQRGKKTYSNPRAAASGILQGSGQFAMFLEFMLWEVPTLPSRLFDGDDSHTVRMKRAHYLGVGVNKPLPSVDYENVASTIETWIAERESFPYMIDGVVIKVDDIYDREALGWGRKSPRWSTAWKFEPEGATTTVTDVGFQVTAQGSIVPIAQVEPVTVGGFSITSIKMHNLEVLRHSGVYIGDKVTVIRRHDVHNEIAAIDFENRPVDASPPIVPELCPSCNTPTINHPSGMLICPNYHECNDQRVARLKKYLSIDGINIPIPLPVLTAFVKQGKVVDIADLYLLEEEDFLGMKLSGARAQFYAKRLDEVLDLPPVVHLASLSIPTIAGNAAALLADHWMLDALAVAAMSTEGRKEISDLIGEKRMTALYEFCSDERGASLLGKLGRLLRYCGTIKC